MLIHQAVSYLQVGRDQQTTYLTFSPGYFIKRDYNYLLVRNIT